MFFLSCVCYAFVHVCLIVPCGHLLSFVVYNYEFCYFPIGILGQVWYLIVSIPILCALTYFKLQVVSLQYLRGRIQFFFNAVNVADGHSVRPNKNTCV